MRKSVVFLGVVAIIAILACNTLAPTPTLIPTPTPPKGIPFSRQEFLDQLTSYKWSDSGIDGRGRHLYTGVTTGTKLFELVTLRSMPDDTEKLLQVGYAFASFGDAQAYKLGRNNMWQFVKLVIPDWDESIGEKMLLKGGGVINVNDLNVTINITQDATVGTIVGVEIETNNF